MHIKPLNCRPYNINATLHVGFLCLRLYFHEYANFIRNYSAPSVWGAGRGGGKSITRRAVSCPAVYTEMRSLSVYTRRKKPEEILDQQVIKGHKDNRDNNARTIVHVSISNCTYREKAKIFIPN